MKRISALTFVTAALLVGGCIDTKDIGLESESGAETTDPADTDSAGSHTGPESGAETTEPADTDSAGSHTGPETDGGTTDPADTDSAGSHTGPETDGETTDGFDEEAQLCLDTDGEWHEDSCGHYSCGAPPDCAAVIPGCDCGPTQNFDETLGCVEDDACEPFDFACGDDLMCEGTSEYCDVLIPGVPKVPFSYACEPLPAACVGDATCQCLEDEGIIAGPDEVDCELSGDGGLIVTTSAP